MVWNVRSWSLEVWKGGVIENWSEMSKVGLYKFENVVLFKNWSGGCSLLVVP